MAGAATTTNGFTNGHATAASQQKSSIAIDHRTNRSIPMFLLHHIVRPFATGLVSAKKEYPPGSPQLEPPNKVRRKFNIKESKVEDIYLYELIPKNVSRQDGSATTGRKRKRLYYFAGGGWQMPPTPGHWALCADMAIEVPDTTVTIVSYPLAPNSPASVCFETLLKLYKRLCHDAAKEQEGVILAGDSAGGNIVLCLTLAALAEDDSSPAPIALMVISPSCDLSRKNPDIQAVAPHDPILRVPFIKGTADRWRGDWDASDPRISPLMGDVRLLATKGVEVHGVVGRYDILSPDVLLFIKKCAEAGVRGKWLDWEKQMHVFPLAFSYKLPESVEGKKWVMEVLRSI